MRDAEKTIGTLVAKTKPAFISKGLSQTARTVFI